MKLSMVLAIFFLFSPTVEAQKQGALESERERAVKRCKENRGTDCELKDGLRDWIREERPLTDAERQAAAAGRRHREECARNKKGAGC